MLFKTKNICSICAILVMGEIIAPRGAYALGTRAGDFDFKLTGYGMAGILEPNFEKPDFLGDFLVRGQVSYNGLGDHSFGLVYAMNEAALDEDEWYEDLFGYWQWRGVGRIEIGLTDSVAHKLGLGLPDVGGMRINSDSLIYRKMGTGGGPVIANPTISVGDSALRANIVSASHSTVQYGFSVAGFGDSYDYDIGAGIKFKFSDAKTKYALSIAAAFIDSPSDYRTDTFTPTISADYRAQAAIGMNIQYNSFVFGIDTRIIYDENPIDDVTDGILAGAGISYDLLNYTMSISYIMSDTGIWHSDAVNYIDHTAIASFRYKYSQLVDGWTSVGISRGEFFLGAGLRLNF